MNGKQISGLITSVLGVIIVIMSIYTKVHIKNIDQALSQLPKTPIEKLFCETIQKDLHKYKVASSWGLGAGIILTVASVGSIFYCRKK